MIFAICHQLNECGEWRLGTSWQSSEVAEPRGMVEVIWLKPPVGWVVPNSDKQVNEGFFSVAQDLPSSVSCINPVQIIWNERSI
jgi:hypothetical protein